MKWKGKQIGDPDVATIRKQYANVPGINVSKLSDAQVLDVYNKYLKLKNDVSSNFSAGDNTIFATANAQKWIPKYYAGKDSVVQNKVDSLLNADATMIWPSRTSITFDADGFYDRRDKSVNTILPYVAPHEIQHKIDDLNKEPMIQYGVDFSKVPARKKENESYFSGKDSAYYNNPYEISARKMSTLYHLGTDNVNKNTLDSLYNVKDSNLPTDVYDFLQQNRFQKDSLLNYLNKKQPIRFKDGGSVGDPLTSAIDKVFEQNKSVPFVSRILNKDARYIADPSGKGDFSTHMLESADNIVYPLIQDVDGKLQYLDSKQAYERALKTGDYVKLPDDKIAAQAGTSYKKSKYWAPYEKTVQDKWNADKGVTATTPQLQYQWKRSGTPVTTGTTTIAKNSSPSELEEYAKYSTSATSGTPYTPPPQSGAIEQDYTPEMIAASFIGVPAIFRGTSIGAKIGNAAVDVVSPFGKKKVWKDDYSFLDEDMDMLENIRLHKEADNIFPKDKYIVEGQNYAKNWFINASHKKYKDYGINQNAIYRNSQNLNVKYDFPDDALGTYGEGYYGKKYAKVSNELMGTKQASSTAAHEGTHYILEGDNLITSELSDELTSSFQRPFLKGPKVNKAYDYYSEPAEIYARITQIRQHANLKPGELLTSEQLDNAIEALPGVKQSMEFVPDKKIFLNTINKIPTIISPVIGLGIGIGSAQSQNSKKYKKANGSK